MSSENIRFLEIERIFEAKIKPETLAIKASRMQGVTNVTLESNIESKTITYKSEVGLQTHPPTNRGGTRENAGRESANYCQPAIALGEKEILVAALSSENVGFFMNMPGSASRF